MTAVDRRPNLAHIGHPHHGIHHHSHSAEDFGIKYQEMSPEVTLVEFISTSASFHGVKRLAIKDLEWEILKVFPNNIMPANAAAWYMAKRRFYVNQTADNQLLPVLLRNYPRKFAISGGIVEFLEEYSKEVARRKMNQMIRQGLIAYFSHKVEEYGVYFFDPFYYETVEPFHENLRAVMQKSGNTVRSKLLQKFFNMHKNKFVFQMHSPNLVTISREQVEVRINTTGIIVSMIDNQFGIIQFPSGNGTEKAFFSAKALFRDGYLYQGDPMKLPPMEFDGYRVPMLSSKSKDGGSMSFTWHAVLVWCGRKPNPKFCSTKEDFINSPYFHGQLTPGMVAPNGCVSYDELMSKSPSKAPILGSGKGGCMQVGQVLSIRKNGAVVSLGKDSKEEAFIPGWSYKNSNIPGNFLSTSQGVELALKDVITFCIDPNAEIGEHKTVGCNVTVLKHAQERKPEFQMNPGFDMNYGVSFVAGQPYLGHGVHAQAHFDAEKVKAKKKRNRKKSVSTSDKETITEVQQQGKKKEKSRRKQKSESKSESEKDEKPKEVKKRVPKSYLNFLLHEEISEEDNYDSDEDPSFLAPPSHDPELDYDEYSDGEVPEEETQNLLKEQSDELEIEELRAKLDKILEVDEVEDEENEEKVDGNCLKGESKATDEKAVEVKKVTEKADEVKVTEKAEEVKKVAEKAKVVEKKATDKVTEVKKSEEVKKVSEKAKVVEKKATAEDSKVKVTEKKASEDNKVKVSDKKAETVEKKAA